MEEIERRERMLRIPEIMERHRYHEKGFNKVSGWGRKRKDRIASGCRCVAVKLGMVKVERVPGRSPTAFIRVANSENVNMWGLSA